MKKIIMLAPLAGYTNLAYREFMKPFGVDIVVSEMISDFALHYKNEETFKMVKTSSIEKPVAIQLFGGQKESLINGLNVLQEIGDYDYLDINLGCPVNKVIKNNAGSSWLRKSRHYELYDAISSLVKLSKKPVTCKIRLGWTEDEITVIDVCRLLEKAGVSLICIHGRTRSQMYSGKADYTLIKKAKESVNIPIIANGDIDSLEKAIEVINYTNCDGIAIGRGCLGNPHLIKQIKTYFEEGVVLPPTSIQEQISYLKEHFDRLIDLKGEYSAIREIRGIASWYLKGFKNVKEYKINLSRVNTKEEFYTQLNEILMNKDIVRC